LEKLYRLGNSYQFTSGFLKFLDVLIGQKPSWKVATVVIKLFWKPITKHRKVWKAANKYNLNLPV
jgi:hypothetical protein